MAYTVRLRSSAPTDLEYLVKVVRLTMEPHHRLHAATFQTKNYKGVTLHDVRLATAKPYYGNMPLELECRRCGEHRTQHTTQLRCPYASTYFWPANIPDHNKDAVKAPRRGAWLSFADWAVLNDLLNYTLTSHEVAAEIFSKRYMPDCACARPKGCQRYWIRRWPNLHRIEWTGDCGRDLRLFQPGVKP